MIKKIIFFIRTRFKSFRYAFRGFRDMVLTEPNAWVHGTVTIIVLFLCWRLRIGEVEFALIILSIMSVWAAEAFNTVLELMMDYVSSKNYSPLIRRAKDISAAGVLVASLGAGVVGVSILGPRLVERILKMMHYS